MGDDEFFDPIPPPAPPWLAPLLGLAFLIAFDWLLYARIAFVQWTTDLVLLQHPRAESWLLFLAFAPIAAAVLLGAAARLRPHLTQTDDRRSYVFLAFAEAFPALLVLAAALGALSLESRFDSWIQSKHGLNFSGQVYRLEGAAIASFQAGLRPVFLAPVLDPVFVAAHTYGLLVLGLTLPLWYAWRRDDRALAATSWGSLVVVAIALPLYAILPVDPPWAALTGLSQPVLRSAAPGGVLELAPNNGIPVLHAAVATLAMALTLTARRWIPAAALAAPAALVALAPLYLGEAWFLGWAFGVALGLMGAWATRRTVAAGRHAPMER